MVVNYTFTSQTTGDTALHLAARLGYADVINVLQDAGGDLSLKNKVRRWIVEMGGRP